MTPEQKIQRLRDLADSLERGGEEAVLAALIVGPIFDPIQMTEGTGSVTPTTRMEVTK